MDDVNIYNAFLPTLLAGILTFASPCILPMFPIFLGMITGNSKNNISVVWQTLMFCLGFSISFAILGATASFLGNLLNENFSKINMVLSCIIIVLGLHSLGVIRIPILEKTLQLNINRTSCFTSIFLGFIFGFGWSPCSGPILGSILMLAATTETLLTGVFLLLIYSFGIAIPFMIFSVFFSKLECVLLTMKKYSEYVQKFGGLLLIIFGCYMLIKAG